MAQLPCPHCQDHESSNLMICCDRCQIWFHYQCINTDWDLPLKINQIEAINEYYCYPCRRANPLLKARYFSAANFNHRMRRLGPHPGNSSNLNKSDSSLPASLFKEQTTLNNQYRRSIDNFVLGTQNRDQMSSKPYASSNGGGSGNEPPANDIVSPTKRDKQRLSMISSTASVLDKKRHRTKNNRSNPTEADSNWSNKIHTER